MVSREIDLDPGMTKSASFHESLAQIYAGFGALSSEYCVSLFADAYDAHFHLLFTTYIEVIRQTGRNHILTTNREERPLFATLAQFEPLGCIQKSVPLNPQGQVTQELLSEAIRPRTALVSLAWANNLTGVIHPMEDLVRVCREKEVYVHVDVSALFGKYFFRLRDLQVDFLTFTSEEATVLFCKKSSFSKEQKPLTANLLHALNSSVQKKISAFHHFCTETARLKTRFEKAVQSLFPEAIVLFEHVERLPHCSVIAFPGVHSEMLLYALKRRGIDARRGGGEQQKLSELLSASGVEPCLSHAALSFSLSYEMTEEQIDSIAEVIGALAHKLKKYGSAFESELLARMGR
jgi:cysteine desulfurase